MSGRVVAELGRPETPAETAARKAESSRVYRGSQNVRNLIAALLATIAIVAVIVLIVPRGELAEPKQVDVAKTAAQVESSTGKTVLTPATPKDWRVNRARLAQGLTPTWSIVYAPNAESEDTGFLTAAQVMGGTEASVANLVVGARAEGEVTVDGVTWTEYTVRASDQSKNVTYVLSTHAGDDQVVLYGSATKKITKQFAASLTEQLAALSATQGE